MAVMCAHTRAGRDAHVVQASLHGALTSREIDAGGKLVTSILSEADATYARDALAKALYSA
jgi:myosin heavy subunit